MAANDRLWIAYLKSSTRAYSDFLVWAGEERAKIQATYKRSKDWGEHQLVSGEEKALDNLVALFTMTDREERQQLDYERSQNGK